MKSLKSRMETVSDRENTKLPIVILDSILPRQVLKLQVGTTEDALFCDLVAKLLQQESPFLGMVGTATLANTGQNLPLQNGCQVEIADATIQDKDQLRVTLIGRRRFRMVGELGQNDRGWTDARVQYFDSSEEERAEDPEALQRAIVAAQSMVDPNNHLVEQWLTLARQHERNPGQIDELLRDLGSMPNPTSEPTELALWVGALINPLPGISVAMEIRPALLMARSIEEKVLVALKGLTQSIQHMDGTKKLF